jgi:pimeloyl-ACP methyl ester carboxylesterase
MEVRAFLFGVGEQRLFGVLHLPVETDSRRSGDGFVRRGVLLCPPLGSEAIRTHRTYVQLARRLAAAGLPVLRFDPRGSGDSGGDDRDWNLQGLLEDVALACGELSARGRVAEVVTVGLRLGASLAFLAAQRAIEISSVVLCDPVVSGETYFQERLREHSEWLAGSFAKARGGSAPGVEILGFRFPERFVSELRDLDLRRAPTRIPRDVLLIESEASRCLGLAEALELRGADVERREMGSMSSAARDPASGKAHVPVAVLEAITAWVERPLQRLAPPDSGARPGEAWGEEGVTDVV